MPTYIAMLRGINVSGHNIVKMERLRASFESLKLHDVRTYVQSGNVIFRATGGSATRLSQRVHEVMQRDFGFTVPLLLRSVDELNAVMKSNPFLKRRSIDPARLHVTFLSDAPQKADLKGLAALPAGPDEYHLAKREIYLYCPEGYGRTKLSNTALERVLSVVATTRNWKTAGTLLDMAQR